MKKSFEDTVNQVNMDGRIMYIYAGHDVNVVALWRSLGFQDLLEPEYGASLVLELHEEIEQDSFFVKVNFKNCYNDLTKYNKNKLRDLISYLYTIPYQAVLINLKVMVYMCVVIVCYHYNILQFIYIM